MLRTLWLSFLVSSPMVWACTRVHTHTHKYTYTNRHKPLPTHTWGWTHTSGPTPTCILLNYTSHIAPYNLNTPKHSLPTLNEIHPPHTHMSKSRYNALSSHTLIHTCKHISIAPAMHSFNNTIQLTLSASEIYHTLCQNLPTHKVHTPHAHLPTRHIDTHSSTPHHSPYSIFI